MSERADVDAKFWVWWCHEYGWHRYLAVERSNRYKFSRCAGKGHEGCGPRRVQVTEIFTEAAP